MEDRVEVFIVGLLWLGCCRAGQEFYTVNGESLSTDFCLTVSCLYYQHKSADHHLGVSLAGMDIRIWICEIYAAKVGLSGYQQSRMFNVIDTRASIVNCS